MLENHRTNSSDAPFVTIHSRPKAYELGMLFVASYRYFSWDIKVKSLQMCGRGSAGLPLSRVKHNL
jgi:hypothetical protein